MKTFCQYFLLLMNVASFLQIIYTDINGRAKKEPQGFGGVVITLISTALTLVAFYYAGAMSEILR